MRFTHIALSVTGCYFSPFIPTYYPNPLCSPHLSFFAPDSSSLLSCLFTSLSLFFHPFFLTHFFLSFAALPLSPYVTHLFNCSLDLQRSGGLVGAGVYMWGWWTDDERKWRRREEGQESWWWWGGVSQDN